jgi:hypothetical protein
MAVMRERALADILWRVHLPEGEYELTTAWTDIPNEDLWSALLADAERMCAIEHPQNIRALDTSAVDPQRHLLRRLELAVEHLCAEATDKLSAPMTAFGEGTWLVGSDIEPGTYVQSHRTSLGRHHPICCVSGAGERRERDRHVHRWHRRFGRTRFLRRGVHLRLV